MTKKHRVTVNFITAALLGVSLLAPVASRASDAAPEAAPRQLFHVTLHTPAEIEGMLARAEQLAKTRPAKDPRAGIALVLHGPEVELFARRNYSRYRHIVDLAARLDAAGVIEVKMCRSEMRARHIGERDVPDFIEVVPYGPDEEQRLLRNGYVYL